MKLLFMNLLPPRSLGAAPIRAEVSHDFRLLRSKEIVRRKNSLHQPFGKQNNSTGQGERLVHVVRNQ
jgi:hypothetical protein